MSALRVIPTDKLIPDPDVQLGFTFDKRKAERMLANWDDRFVGVLTVTPAPDGEHYYVIGGRHRLWAGTRKGITEFRCDVHAGPLTRAEKAEIKMGEDFHRRNVRPVEHFLQLEMIGREREVSITRIAAEYGYSIGKLKNGGPYNVIESVVTLQRIWDQIGADGLRRTFALAKNWIEDKNGNSGMWLGALALLIRDGYDEVWTDSQAAVIREQVPSIVIRKARGDVGHLGANGNKNTTSRIEYVIAARLRKAARMRVRPVGKVRGSGGLAGPLV